MIKNYYKFNYYNSLFSFIFILSGLNFFLFLFSGSINCVYSCTDQDIVNLINNLALENKTISKPNTLISPAADSYPADSYPADSYPADSYLADSGKKTPLKILCSSEAAFITKLIVDTIAPKCPKINIISTSAPAHEMARRLAEGDKEIPDIIFFYGRRFLPAHSLVPSKFPFFIELAHDSMSLIFSKQLKNRKSLALINIIDNNWPDFLIKKIFKFGKINRHTSPMGIRTENMALLAGLHYKKEYPLFLKAWQNNFNKENIYSEYDLMIRDLENGKIDLCFSYYAAAHAAGFEPVNLAPEFNLNGFLSWQKSSLARVEVKYPDYLPEVTAKTYEIAQPVTFCMAIAEEKLKSSPQNISGAASEFLKLFFDSANLIFSKCGLKSLHIVEDTKFLLHIH